MARLRKSSPEAPRRGRWRWPANPLDHREATRLARTHPDVLTAQDRLNAYLLAQGIARPEDPRYVLMPRYSHVFYGDEYRRLRDERAEAFERVRSRLMGREPFQHRIAERSETAQERAN